MVAVGAKGTILQWNGQAWSSAASPVGLTLRSVWGRSPKDIYAVGEAGSIVHFDGQRWALQPSGTQRNLNGIHGNRSSVMAVGAWGTLLTLTDGRWAPMPLPTQPTLNAIAVEDNGQAVAVGDIGALLEYDGQTWREANSGTGHPLYTVARIDQGWLAAGREGTVIAKEGSAWLKKKSGPAQLMGIGRGDKGQLLIVGALGTIHMP
jgi:hypothetical protein